jgi:hypothetical protein
MANIIFIIYLITICITIGPIYYSDLTSDDESYAFLKSLGVSSFFGWLFIIMLFNDKHAKNACKNFYTKERMLNAAYFLPIISLGLLWLI